MKKGRFEPLVETFLDWLLHNKGRSPRTAEAYRLALDRLGVFASAVPKDPLDLGAEELALFAGVWLHKRGVGPRSRRPYVAAVRMFFKWAKARGEVVVDRASTLDYPMAGLRLPNVMTLEHLEKLMWAPDFSTLMGLRDAAIMAVLAGAGLRVSGLTRLNESHLVRQALVREEEQRLFVRVVEKGDKQRLVPLPEEAALMVGMYLAHAELAKIDRVLEDGDRVLFVSFRNMAVPAHEYRGERRRLKRKAIYRLLQTYGKRAGIPKEQLHPHALRHAFGNELAESDVDLLTRQKLMGHADPKSTAIYELTAVRRLAREVDRANPLAKINTQVSEILRTMKAARPSRRRQDKGT